MADEPHWVVRTSSADLKAATVLGNHAHDWHQLIYVSAGLMNVATEAGSWVAPATWAVWVPAGVRHGIRFVVDSAFRTAYFRPGWVETYPGACTVVSVSALLRELILRAIKIGQLDRRHPLETAIAALIVSELQVSGARSLSLKQPTGAAMYRAATLINNKDPQAATLSSLARAVGIGTRTFERQFFAETGMTPGRWRQHQAMLKGLELLATGTAIKSVAAHAGYRTASAFIAAFRKVFGTTPANYFSQSDSS
ncbi:MAG TPA: helix-turn-helix transcriptional regulator [Steroidobacteraceae bacterium]|nr:helix-turn-helix transcriptional regulator [Steroidobacteraceae bacterium]